MLSPKQSAMPLRRDLANLTAIESKLGAVDVLVNNTGGPPPITALGQKPVLWRKFFGSMVLSVIALTDRVVPGMRERKWGRVITSTSSGIVAPIPNLAISNDLDPPGAPRRVLTIVNYGVAVSGAASLSGR
jgi:3-oxoacyl-[acyl-carrier protein] reductase